ncbi:MAG: DUF2188 domain-containing protein [Pseudomonadota bacterium]|jgi:hypothetical protein|nr:DUF2188 domain-containing protein [Pseudomonadota bacterium]
MATPGLPLLSVTQTKDGVWSVNERGPTRVAIAYFPNKWGAMKHAVRVAKAKRRARVAVLERDGVVHLSRDYNEGPDSTRVETP